MSTAQRGSVSKVGSKRASISKEPHIIARTASMSIECVSQQRSHSIMGLPEQQAQQQININVASALHPFSIPVVDTHSRRLSRHKVYESATIDRNSASLMMHGMHMPASNLTTGQHSLVPSPHGQNFHQNMMPGDTSRFEISSRKTNERQIIQKPRRKAKNVLQKASK